jgi:hypothetical protein
MIIRHEIIRHDTEFGVEKILNEPVPLRLHGRVHRGMVIEGQIFTVLSENTHNFELTPEGTPANTIRPIAKVNLRVEGIWMFGKRTSWVLQGDSPVIVVSGEGGNLVKRWLVLSTPEVDSTTLK